ncbi:ribose 5-phosphate isomerase B [Sphingomonas sp. SM33]|jgi:ribose 5-phosphate isomerase B|uniref:Ribose 5-phosphate isomerase B n=1 Tax=Sphingomonas telluris TaxID=2907998 RepID=A0ABS9VJF1_9SPHN|nr:ribose 5-phosphate isomerase B [Sphingomonas telluris]MCH8615116.1 ribose 5-phosphate isomerase B [Sphingomonas telluris]
MRIALSADHAGFEMKDQLADWLRADGHEIVDLGTNGPESVDYPRYGALLAEALADGRAERGITVCGSGIGVAIAANRNPACRCAQVAEPVSAALARKHNDANAIALGARLIGLEMAKACVTAFLSSDFLGGRHQPRVDQLANPTHEQEPA